MNSIFAVLCLAVAAQADLPADIVTLVNTPGEQYKLYKEYTSKMELTKEAQKDLHTGLNIARGDKDVDKKDLELFYWHEDLKYAIPKFLAMIDDGPQKDGKIKVEELANDVKKKPIIMALTECAYLLSPGLREACYADQLLVYAALVMDDQDVTSFYESIDTDKKPGLTKEEVEGIKHEKNKDKTITAEELGAYTGNDGVTRDEFKDYVTQESVNDDFRRCRKTTDKTTGNIDFDNKCLLEELVEYTNDDLTELDISVLFRAIDGDKTNKITKAEINKIFGDKADEATLKTIMETLDMSGTTAPGEEATIDYGEFRTYMKSPTVLLQLEKKCTEAKDKQIEELTCMFDEFKDLVSDGHNAIWLMVPDLDQTIVYEIFDKDNNGKIEMKDIKFKNEPAKKRFFDEIDRDKGKYVCMEEFNEYMDIPHMVYGTADCLLHTRTTPEVRGTCFTDEVEEVLDNIKFIEKTAFTDWFKYYDDGNNRVIDSTDTKLKDKLTEKLVPLFLSELGQGGKKVSHFEFTWYVKQQELADRYEKKKIITGETKNFDDGMLTKLNTELKNYIENDVTEYDVQEFFDELDKEVDGRDDHELTEKDFEKEVWTKIKDLIEKIDAIDPEGDADKTVNFREFWMWLNSPKTPGDKTTLIKDTFEQACTVKEDSQKKEIDCYVKTFKAGKF